MLFIIYRNNKMMVKLWQEMSKHKSHCCLIKQTEVVAWHFTCILWSYINKYVHTLKHSVLFITVRLRILLPKWWYLMLPPSKKIMIFNNKYKPQQWKVDNRPPHADSIRTKWKPKLLTQEGKLTLLVTSNFGSAGETNRI